MKILKKKLMMFGIIFILILFGVANINGRNKIKNAVVDIKEQCQDNGFSFIRDIYSYDERICVTCIDIDYLDQNKMAGNEITLCSYE